MTQKRHFFLFIVILSSLFLLSGKTSLYAKEESTVTIENARKTSYYTDEESGDEIILFTGGVVVSVKQGKETTAISADTVHYNRSRNILYAQGSVSLERSGGENTEKMTANSLLLNVDNKEGIFDDGRVVQTGTDTMNVPSGSTLIVSADLFGKDDSGAIAFKKGNLTFCDEPDPHWKIKATRIWLLPGNEFAFANALLYVGHIPVMYFPFFYYPKDELIFNPVFGYRQREGYFFQTTTYLIGRKPLASTKDDDSFLSFMKPTKLKKQKREGLVLRNLNEDDKENYPHTLKFMADYYTNLGGMVGFDGAFKPKDTWLDNLNVALFIGMSRTLFQTQQSGDIYTPYSSSGESFYNKSDFLGLKLPFRYKGNLEFSMTTPFTLKLSMPIYSDPFFTRDFTYYRKETMDWIDMLLSSGEEDDEDDDDHEETSFTWNLTSSYTPKLDFAKPYLDRLTFSPSASMVFSSKTDTSDLTQEEALVSPSRKFFYPSQIKPFAITMSAAGTIFEYPKTKRVSSQVKSKIPRLNVPPEFESEDKKEHDDTESDDTEKQEESTQQDETTQENLPLIAIKAPSASKISGLTYSLGYTIQPSLVTEISYDAPATRNDFNWEDLKSTFFKFTSETKLSSTLGYRDSFISLNNNLEFSPVVQRHPEYKVESGRETAIKNDYTSQKMDLENTNSLSFKPLIYSSIFKNTSLSWNTGIKLVRTSFVGTVEKPEWEYELPEWDDESFSNHTMNFTFAAEEGDFSQKLTLSTNLPPKVDQYTGTLSFGFPYFTTSVSAGIKQKSATDEEWVFNPLNQSASLSLFSDKLKLSSTFKYDMEEKNSSSYSLSLSAFNLSVSYSMLYTNDYEFNENSGWKTTDEKNFQPVYLRFNYRSGAKDFTFLGDKVKFSPSISTTLYYDMQRPTNSYFTFDPAISFVINDLLTLTFSSSSKNQVIYRYIQEHTGFEPKIPGETNIFKDLINSFAFWDKAKRESSGFKLKSLNIKLTHELHDWQLASEFEIEPRIITENGQKRYDFSPYFTISVLWKPMESIKATIEDEYGTLHLNP